MREKGENIFEQVSPASLEVEKYYKQRIMELGLERHLKGTFEELRSFALNYTDYKKEHHLDELTVHNCPPSLQCILEEDPSSPAICYDLRKEFEAMKSHLLALSKFTICTNNNCDQNLSTFVVLLHDFPLKPEKTALYGLVKKWKSSSDIEEAVNFP